MNTPVKLTTLSHGGGCGCKIAPDVLSTLLRDTLPNGAFPQLLVGNQSNDDAAVYLLNADQALIATTDFFMPIVDDPFDFGRIAAANALSDVYAMGGTPILALALVGMPLQTLATDTINAILKGGASICEQAGIPVAGGHSIDSVEPIYGLAVNGLVHPAHLRRNDTAQAGDTIILTKGLGVGVLSAALKKDTLSPAGYAALMASTTQLNTPGSWLAQQPDVRALTDVTGFSLVGHTLEMCRGAGLAAQLDFASLPWLDSVEALVTAGFHTGASARNWRAFGSQVTLGSTLPTHAQTLLTDPQTSGGLLIACTPAAAPRLLARLHAEGFAQAATIGHFTAGAPHLTCS